MPRIHPLAFAATLSGVLAVSGCAAGAPGDGEVLSAMYSRVSAATGFADATYGVRERTELDALASVLRQHDIVGSYESDGESCDDAGATFISYSTTAGSSQLTVSECDMNDFEADVTRLVAGWQEAGDHEVISVP